ncbi:CDP-alcohol phosphatidyltransferase family protein [Breznakiella homolactica]|uniref:CDP-alcohol phosphatidyltransferase family protein n=1 Tax=Breznakiella homolactica TaxID=2798577 RepID=A0A7T8BBL4_9SPIR|nr:CDP-alcohol phosphatidyltransferase family protein [Breznakiella homolactica]QQO10682.1 CDP-alcohol phosphatidyltransferase family protein [Breznakiella homolactica]
MGSLRADSLSKSLSKSIIGTAVLYCLLEMAGFLAVAFSLSFPAGFTMLFAAVQIVFHIGLILFLLYNSALFYNLSSGEHMTKVNIANKITMIRISMVPFLLFLILAASQYPVGPILVPATALTFLTDLIDGHVSRSRKEETYMGKILDSISDYSLLMVVGIAYYIFQLLPAWLFWLIVFRLLFQGILMLILYIRRQKLIPQTTIFGKVAVASTMVLFALELVRIVFPSLVPYLIYPEIIVGILISLSIIDKAVYFIKSIRA